MSIGLLGKKLGMTRVYDEKGRVMTATVIEADGNRVLQVKTMEKDGYHAVQVGFDDQKRQRVSKAQAGHFANYRARPRNSFASFVLRTKRRFLTTSATSP